MFTFSAEQKRPLFANKIKVKNEITLNEDSKSANDDQKVANIFNSFFVNTASSNKNIL